MQRIVPQWVIDTYVKLRARTNETEAQCKDYRDAILNFMVDEGYACPDNGDNLVAITWASENADWKAIAERLANRLYGKDRGPAYIAKQVRLANKQKFPKLLIKPNGEN